MDVWPWIRKYTSLQTADSAIRHGVAPWVGWKDTTVVVRSPSLSPHYLVPIVLAGDFFGWSAAGSEFFPQSVGSAIMSDFSEREQLQNREK